MNFYSFGRIVCLFIFNIYFKIVVCGQQNIEDLNNGAVLISNHSSYLDPIMLGLYLKKRRLFFMAKKELFKVPILNIIIKKLGAFPVDRKARNSAALEHAVDIVNDGKIVAMFPQGHRCKKNNDLKPKTGFMRIALKSRCLILPCYVNYMGYKPRSRVYVCYGNPIDLREFTKKEGISLDGLSFSDVKTLTLKVWQNVLALS